MKKSTKKLTLVLVSVLIFVLCIGVMVACDNLSDHDFSGEWKMDGTKHWKECECGAKGLETAHIDIDENGTCDICGYDKMHVHSYGDWKSDGVNHWKECSCGEQIEKSAHVVGSDEKCTICGYNTHEHSYGEWKSNETNHWKECSCGLKSEEGAHVDSNNDEKCDTCNYDMHVHSYAEAWSKDATNHWHECSCGAKSDEAAHVDENSDYKCDTCGYVIFAFPEAVRGEWYLEDGTEITIGEASFNNGLMGFNFYTSVKNGVTYYNFTLRNTNHCVYTDGEDWYFGKWVMGHLDSYEKLLAEAPEAATIPEELQGTWVNTEKDISITIGETSIEGDIYADLTQGDFTVTDNGDGTYTIDDAYDGAYSLTLKDDSTIEYTYVEYDIDWSIIGQPSVTLTKSSGESGLGTLVLNDNTISATASGKDATFTSAEGGKYILTNNNSALTIKYFDGDALSWTEISASKFEFTLTAEDSMRFRFISETEGEYSVNISVPTYTITVKGLDSKAIAGVTVTIGDVSATTDESGEATLNAFAGEIKLSGYDSKYTYTTVSADYDDFDVYITLTHDVTNTFIVEKNNTGMSDITVKIMDGDSFITSGKTNSEGKVSLTYAGAKEGNYKIVLEGLAEGDLASGLSISKNNNGIDKTITVRSMEAYEITVECGEGVECSLEGLTVSMYESKRTGETLLASAKTDAAGKVTLYTQYSKANGYIVRVSGIDETKYSVEDGKVDEYLGTDSEGKTIISHSTTITINLIGSGSEDDDDINSLELGTALKIEMKEDADGNPTSQSVKFTSEKGGKYTITLNDDFGGSCVYTKEGFDNWENPILMNCGEDGIITTYNFTLEAGKSIVFVCISVNYDEEIDYTLTVTEASGGSTTPSTVLTFGKNTVTGTNGSEDVPATAYTFTATEDADYVLSSTDGNAFFMVNEDTGTVGSDCKFSLKKGETITIYFGTYSWGESTSTYEITIAYDNGAK